MYELDGSAAGGQFLRSALSLAAITGEPVRISGIRGSRDPPGLRPQHLAGVRTIAEICSATVDGAVTSSECLTFIPDSPRGGSYTTDIGTAGSITLVFDLVLPLSTRLSTPLDVTVTGGTDVKWAPTLAYYERIKLPLLRKFGFLSAVERHRTGYYPDGGGTATLAVSPAHCTPVTLTAPGSPHGIWIDSTSAESLREQEVAERQARAATEVLSELGIPILESTTRYVDTDGPGTSITVCLEYENTRLGGTAIGERGVPAETVGRRAANRALTPYETSAVVDRHMADQLLLPLALTGGSITIPEATDHVTTSLNLLGEFGYEIHRSSGNQTKVLSASPSNPTA